MSNRIRRAAQIIRKQNWAAILIELIIVVLGVTIAYQLNLYQQKVSNKKIERSLLSKVYVENDQNLAEMERIAEFAYKKPIYQKQLLSFLDSLGRTGQVNNVVIDEVFWMRFEEIVSTFSASLNDQNLSTYMNRSFETGAGLLDPELMKLQSLFIQLRELESVLTEYRIGYIWTYTDRAYNRDKGNINLNIMMDNTFRNQLMKLANIENERSTTVTAIIDQLKRIKNTLETSGYKH